MTTDLPPGAPAADTRTPWQAARDHAEQTGTWPEAWGPYHRHFASDAIHRDGGSECDQAGTSRRVYVFDPDALSAHEAAVEAAARASERERVAALARDLAFTLSRPGNGPAHEERLEVVPLAELLAAMDSREETTDGT
jgi:hypothetical protein